MPARKTSPWLGPLLLLFVCATVTAPVAAVEPSRLLLILDASGSMWGQVSGENKIVIARRVLGKLIADLPDGSEAGLIAYGHRRERDCQDIETIVPLGPLDRATLTEKVIGLNPKGKTPITGSLLKALESVGGAGGPVTILLVSDGIETCGGDPCRVVREAREGGADFLMHVIGFDVEKVDVAQLECAAQAGGGLYLGARDAGELKDALHQAVEAPAEYPSRLSVKATAEGELIDATVRVTDTASGEEVAAGRTYTAAETNPRLLPVPAGTYNIHVQAVRFEGNVRRDFNKVVVADGETVAKHADFSVGELSVRVTRNGALSDAAVRVYTTGVEKRVEVAGSRSYAHEKSNPTFFSITPGEYEVEVKSVEISGGPTVKLPVKVTSGATTELAHEFASGMMKVGAVSGGELADATVNVVSVETGASVGQGRTYAASTSNPRTFELPPGKYRVTLTGVKLEGSPKQVIELTVEQGTVVETMVDLGR
jgi:Ca-activated chloride channel family protein